MKKRVLVVTATAVLAALTVASAMPPAPAFAQQPEACLQNNHIWGWRVINERTLIVSDIDYRPFVVHLTGGCVGLTDAIFGIRIRTWTSLGCLGHGDRVSFRAPALGPMSCIVTAVEPYAGAVGGSYGDYHRYDGR
jgi:hypothetical protein